MTYYYVMQIKWSVKKKCCVDKLLFFHYCFFYYLMIWYLNNNHFIFKSCLINYISVTCGGELNVTSDATIFGYSGSYRFGQQCNWYIKVQLKFVFSIYKYAFVLKFFDTFIQRKQKFLTDERKNVKKNDRTKNIF